MGPQSETMLHQLVFQSLLGEIDYGAMGDFTPAGYNQAGVWGWNVHDGDWIYQGGPDSTEVKNMPYYNRGRWHLLNCKAARSCVFLAYSRSVLCTEPGRNLFSAP